MGDVEQFLLAVVSQLDVWVLCDVTVSLQCFLFCFLSYDGSLAERYR